MQMYGIPHVGNLGNNFCGEAHKLICRNVGNEILCFPLEFVTTTTYIVGPDIPLYALVGKHCNIFWDAEVHKRNDGIRMIRIADA